jgi:hypothetical protein
VSRGATTPKLASKPVTLGHSWADMFSIPLHFQDGSVGPASGPRNPFPSRHALSGWNVAPCDNCLSLADTQQAISHLAFTVSYRATKKARTQQERTLTMPNMTIHACTRHLKTAFNDFAHMLHNFEGPMPGDSLVCDTRQGCNYCAANVPFPLEA